MTNKYYGNPLAWGGKQRSPAEAQPVAWEWEYIGGDHYPRGHKVARALHEMDPQNPPYPETWRPTRPLVYGDAPPPSAPVGVEDAEVWLFKGTDGAWHTFHNEQHRLDTIADGRWEVRKFTALAQQPAAVDDLMNAWRTAFITERATRYREGGMKIEQARIHAETDATLMEKIARQQQGGES